MNMSCKKENMTWEELKRARQELERRYALSRENGFEAEWCESWVWQYYHPDGTTGRQIYLSYSDDELLDILIAVMDRPGNRPQLNRLHHVFRLYLNRRFQNLSQAKAKARTRKKSLEEQGKWPPDWPQRVTPEPLYRWIAEQGKEVSQQELSIIEEICKTACQTGLPPDMDSPECMCLKKFCGVKRALELMNIPPLSKRDLRFMIPYWRKNRISMQSAQSTVKYKEERL